MNGVSLLRTELTAYRIRYIAGLIASRSKLTARQVHHLREEARRLQVRLELAKDALQDATGSKAIRTVSKQIHALGSLRDIQLQIRRIHELKSGSPGLKPLLVTLRRQACKRAKVAAKRLKVHHLDKRIRLVEAMLAACQENLTTGRQTRVRLARLLSTARRRALGLWGHASSSTKNLHRARIALKRYALIREILPPPSRATLEIRELRRVRKELTLMGKIHDVDILLARIDKSSCRPGRVAAAVVKVHNRLARRRVHLMASRVRSIFNSATKKGNAPTRLQSYRERKGLVEFDL